MISKQDRVKIVHLPQSNTNFDTLCGKEGPANVSRYRANCDACKACKKLLENETSQRLDKLFGLTPR